MRILHKLGLLSLGAALVLSMGVHAAELVDPEGAAVPASSGETVSATPAPDVTNDSAGSGDPETPAAAPQLAEVPQAPPVKKFAVTRDSIRLDGQAVQPAGYNINDENYFKLRDIAYLMNGKQASFSVGYDAKLNSITLATGEPYTPDGSELKGTKAKPTIKYSTAKVLLNGKQVMMTAYNIDGNNYFRLRDIGGSIGFEVDYIDRVVTLQSGPAATHTVTFNMNGHGSQIDASSAVQGSKLTAPQNPQAVGYVFGGWYKEEGCKNAWDFGTDKVTADTTLYASWIKAYTVSFDMNEHGTQVSPKSATAGSTIEAPAAPSASGYRFGGWYQDRACTKVWDFESDKVKADMTLYAKWSATYTLSFNMNGHGSQVSAQSGIVSGSLAKEPAKPTASGYTFGGWYIDQKCTIQWVFSIDKVAQDVVLYAKWTDDKTGELSGDPNASTGGSTPETPAVPDNSSAIDGVLTILVDPGHGGTDPGSAGTGMDENHLNLEVAQYLQEMLESAGVKVIMSRTSTDETLYGTDRKNYVLETCARGDIDLVLSIHHNAANFTAYGAEVLTQSASQNPGGESKELGRLILSEYQKIGQSSRGVKDGSGKYMVYAPSTYGVTAVLSEFCFLDNASDAAKIDSPEERRAEAQALYNAVMKFYESHEY